MEQKQEIADRLKQANNVLVTISNNPSVDQFAAAIGLTLVLSKLGKHATAVFSGAVPSTIEFLEPDKTIEPNTDSLRDFIISLDKTKADKLRYKVEDKVVKIFITPYRTSISDKDLEFSQGDFNVDAVVAIGVHSQTDLDQAITAHGRILHDATVITINVRPQADLGSINWLVPGASSLSELTVELVDAIDKGVLDSQIATAFLTGIVAETKRFSNEKTSPDTMSISAELMAAGANQQLVATKLEEAAPPPAPAPAPVPPAAPADQPAPIPAEPPKPDDGTLEITHTDQPAEEAKPDENADEQPKLEGEDEIKEPGTPRIQIDEQGSLRNIEELEAEKKADEEKKNDETPDPNQHMASSHMLLQPPSSMGGAMNGGDSSEDGYHDPLSLPQPQDPQQGGGDPGSGSFGSSASANITSPNMPFMPPSMTPGGMSTDSGSTPSFSGGGSSSNVIMPPSASDSPSTDSLTSPAPSDTAHVDDARDAVSQAFAFESDPARPEPIQALNAQPLGDPLHDSFVSSNAPPDLTTPVPAGTSQPAGLSMPAPVGAPPPVPPPMMPTSPQ
ncbi:MAG TPA: hypothetical protein VL737_00165 [Candidatus Pristimantibacillus sp.]|nr:hypothetical protein [Candidatus Pristimantibacillus sp.]